MNNCGNCRYWGGSIHLAKTAPCNHPAEIKARERGLMSLARSQTSLCNGWIEKKIKAKS